MGSRPVEGKGPTVRTDPDNPLPAASRFWSRLLSIEEPVAIIQAWPLGHTPHVGL